LKGKNMIRAVYRDGAIQPLDQVPPEWHEGDKLVVEQVETTPSAEEIEEWAAGVEAAAAKISDEDHDKVMAAISEHRAEAKRQMRQEMGLP
jgi:hypothetical protein